MNTTIYNNLARRPTITVPLPYYFTATGKGMSKVNTACFTFFLSGICALADVGFYVRFIPAKSEQVWIPEKVILQPATG